jgi:hypothetical protein
MNAFNPLTSHQAAPSTMYGTTLNYVALRLLGANPDDNGMIEARNWILNNGKPAFFPSGCSVFTFTPMLIRFNIRGIRYSIVGSELGESLVIDFRSI